MYRPILEFIGVEIEHFCAKKNKKTLFARETKLLSVSEVRELSLSLTPTFISSFRPALFITTKYRAHTLLVGKSFSHDLLLTRVPLCMFFFVEQKK